MNKELVRIAKVMYDLQEYCKTVDDVATCDGCLFSISNSNDNCDIAINGNIPCSWNITKADIERLRCEKQ